MKGLKGKPLAVGLSEAHRDLIKLLAVIAFEDLGREAEVVDDASDEESSLATENDPR